MKSHRATALAVLFLLLALAAGCSRNSRAARVEVRDAVPVTVAQVVQKTEPVDVHAIGTVEALSTVAIKAQVTGEVTRVHFREGQEVKKGEPLFTIDPRPFEAALKQAEANLTREIAQARQAQANLAKDTAQAKNADVQARRYAELVKDGVVTKEQYDQMRTNADAAQAGVAADQAAIESAESSIRADRAALDNAKVQLGYCFIVSPMNGRTGSLMVHQGNVVKANENPALVVIHQIHPIYLNFSVPEQYLAQIKRYMGGRRLQVEAILPQEEQRPVWGTLTFVDNAVDVTTGTIRLKATFANEERRLWPGQFVNVVLTLASQPDAIVVPTQAVQTGQAGPYVFVVKSDLTVESRPIVAGRTVGAETVIEKGLRPGEKVVTDGQLRLVPGARVEVKRQEGLS